MPDIKAILLDTFINLITDLWYIFALVFVVRVVLFKVKMLKKLLLKEQKIRSRKLSARTIMYRR